MSDNTEKLILATKLSAEQRFDEALLLINEVIEERPHDSELYSMRGAIARTDCRTDLALDSFGIALARGRDEARHWCNLANTYVDKKWFRTARACYERALAIGPSEPLVYRNLATCLSGLDDHAGAVTVLSEALMRRPGDFAVLWERSVAYLRQGQLAAGWLDQDSRLVSPLDVYKNRPGRQWRGEPYSGKTLLITQEQGFGDAIWAARYFARTKARGGKLIVECNKEQIPLFEQFEAVDQFVPKGERPEADLNCPICSLPGIFTSETKQIEGRPYMQVPAEAVGHCRDLLALAGTKLKVGIVWSGSITYGGNSDRATRLRPFLESFTLPGVQLFSLQVGKPAEEVSSADDADLIDLAPHLSNFAETAAVVAQLDLVIMTCSSVAHLTGALGKPIWVLLNKCAFWLWQDERSDTAWYDSMRLYRPSRWNDWNAVFDRAGRDLLDLARKRATG